MFVYIGEKDFERSVASTRVNTLETESAIGLATSTALTVAETEQQVPGNTDDPVQRARARGAYDRDIGGDSKRMTGKLKRQLLT